MASLKKAPPPEKLLSYVKDKDPLFDPGSRYNYSNTDNIVVALMVESATSRTYEGQLQKQVYGPLGLEKTTLPRGPNLKDPFIHGYDNDPPPPPREDISELIAAGWSWASGGIVSTPADLNDFIRGYVGGDLFDPRTRAKQRRLIEGGRSEPPGPGKNSAGLAVFRYETRCGTVWGHTGNFPGLHPVHGGVTRRQPLGGRIRQRTTDPRSRSRRRLPRPARHRKARRMRRAKRELGIRHQATGFGKSKT